LQRPLLGESIGALRMKRATAPSAAGTARMPRHWPIIAVFVTMIILQASVAAFSIQMLSTVRAYVAGESLYSKGQKDAQIYLLSYAEQHREADYQQFVSALANPLGDRAAREALQRAEPDIAAARRGFLDGGNHPDDIDGLIRMFRLFQHASFMSRPIATWTQGDRTIEDMRRLVDRARERILAGAPQSAEVDEMRRRAPELNEQLTRLTSAFSLQLGEASRTTQRLLLGLNVFFAFLLTVSGLIFIRRSARLQAAAELRMERLIDAVTDGVVTVDDQRTVVLFNRAAERLFSVSAAEALGTSVDRFMRLPDGTALPLVPTTSEALLELDGAREDGAGFPAEASLSRLETERSALTTIVLRDVTARRSADIERRAREASEASNRAKTEFLSRMSHELRTPLNAVIGFSRLLRMDASRPLSVGQIERVQYIENSGAHLLALVNDVLDLSRIESGGMAVSTEAVRLLQVVEEAATMVSPLVTAAGIQIFLSAAVVSGHSDAEASILAAACAKDIEVKADPVRLRQVLVNLLSNAVKYNKPGGRITLTWELCGADCVVRIIDTGHGIAADRLASLFEPFNRLGAESSAVEGTGIGLVLSRQLTEMMGGALVISSVCGEGTCAILSLPLSETPIVRADPPQSHRTPGINGRSLRVLYAEDNEVNAELVRQIVTLRRGVSLRIATNGERALEMARLDAPDLMLVDMNLGDMTGIQLAKELQRDRSTRDIHLVALSADALPEQIKTALGCGFESYMTKPIVLQELLAMLDKHSDEACA
jgi:PAS domain S-box-containing protein